MTDQIERDEEKPEQDLSLEELAAEIPGKEGFLAAQRYVWNNSAEKKGTYGDWVAGQEVFRWIEDDPEVNFSKKETWTRFEIFIANLERTKEDLGAKWMELWQEGLFSKLSVTEDPDFQSRTAKLDGLNFYLELCERQLIICEDYIERKTNDDEFKSVEELTEERLERLVQERKQSFLESLPMQPRGGGSMVSDCDNYAAGIGKLQMNLIDTWLEKNGDLDGVMVETGKDEPGVEEAEPVSEDQKLVHELLGWERALFRNANIRRMFEGEKIAGRTTDVDENQVRQEIANLLETTNNLKVCGYL